MCYDKTGKIGNYWEENGKIYFYYRGVEDKTPISDRYTWGYYYEIQELKDPSPDVLKELGTKPDLSKYP